MDKRSQGSWAVTVQESRGDANVTIYAIIIRY